MRRSVIQVVHITCYHVNQISFQEILGSLFHKFISFSEEFWFQNMRTINLSITSHINQLSQDVLEKVATDLKLELPPKGLASKIKVTVPVDTRIVSISVTDRAPEEASRIANSLREVAAQKIISVTRVSDVTTLEEARPATSPSSPNIRRNTMVGFLAGAVVMVVTVLLVELLDTRVKRPEDIEDVMQIALLGVVPNLDKLK